jgi:hypothetical protein
LILLDTGDDRFRGGRKLDREGVDFLKIELKTAVTLLQLAATEEGLGDRDGAQKAQVLAQEAYANFNRFWPVVQQRVTVEEHNEIKNLHQAVVELMPPI